MNNIKNDFKLSVLIFILTAALSIFYINNLYMFTMDDSYISFRYATNLANFNGLVFNSNELPRSEGITSPFYAGILSVFTYVGFDLELSAKVFGVICMLGVMIVLFKFALLLNKQLQLNNPYVLTLSALGVFYYGVDAYVVSNSLTGMETMLGAFLLILLLYLEVNIILLRIDSRFIGFLFALISVLIPLVRPELTLSVLVLHVVNLFFFKEHRKKFVFAFILFMLIGTVYFIWRYNYFEHFLPLPFYIKQGGSGFFGVGISSRFLYHYSAYIVLIVSGVFLIKNTDKTLNKILATLLFIFSLQFMYYLSIRHIMGFGFRYFQPIMPLAIILVSVASSLLLNLAYKKVKTFSLIIVFLFLLISAAIGYQSLLQAKTDYLSEMSEGIGNTKEVARAFASSTQEYTVAMNDCGAFPYLTMWKIVDLAGLNNRNIALDRSSQMKQSEIQKNDVDIVFLVAKNTKDELYGYEGLKKFDVENMGYSLKGSIEINEHYFWLMYMKNGKDYKGLLNMLIRKKIIEVR